jgi:hypothetical protein
MPDDAAPVSDEPLLSGAKALLSGALVHWIGAAPVEKTSDEGGAL